MRPTLIFLALALLSGILVAGWIAVANRFHVPAAREPVALPASNEKLPRAGSELTSSTWNIGYAGMGRESEQDG